MAYGYPIEEEDRIPLEGEEGTPSFNSGLPQGMTLDQPEPVAPTYTDNRTTYTAIGLPEGIVLDQPEQATQLQPQPISYSGYLYPTIAQQRQQWVSEIDTNPKLREFAAAAMSQEAGDDDAYLGAVESLFNRTQMRKSSISRQLTNGFYGPVNRREVDRIVRRGVEPWMLEKFDKAMDAVRNGSDLIEGRTDQGMYNEIVGPRAKYGSEYFGYMGGDPTWSLQHQRNKGKPGAASYARGQVAPGVTPDIDQGLPPGLTLDKEQPPTSPATASQQLPPGMVLDEKPGGQEQATAAQVQPQEPPSETIQTPEKPLLKLTPGVALKLGMERWIDQDTGMEVRRAQYSDAELKKIEGKRQAERQEQAAKNRGELQGAIEGLEKEGYTVPHTIGKPDEPEGDLAPARDMEELASTLKRKAAYEARTGQFDKSKETAKEAEKWEKKIEEEGNAPWQVKAREFGGEPSAVDKERKEKPSKKEMVDILSGRKDIREKGWIGSQTANAAQRGWYQGQQALEMKKDNPDPVKISELQKKIGALPASDNFKTFMNDKATPGDSFKAFTSDPIGIITELTVESMGSQIPTTLPELHRIPTRMAQFTAAGAGGGALAAGPAGGVAGGAGGASVGFTLGLAEATAAASMVSEKAGSILESFQEAGIDTTNADQLKAAFANKELMAKVREKAEKKGIPVAYFDGLSVIIGGKLFGKPAKTLLKRAGQWTAELAVQMGMGAGGEVAGQVYSEGKVTSVRAAIAEAVGELGGSAAEVAIGIEQMAATDPFKPEVAGTKEAAKSKAPTMNATATQVTQTANGRLNTLRETRDGTPPKVTSMDADGRPVYGEAGKSGRTLLKHEEEELAFLEKNIDNPEAIAETYGIKIKEPPKEEAKPAAVTVPPEIQKKQDRIAEIDKQVDKEFDPEKKAALVDEAIGLSMEVDEAQKTAAPTAEPAPLPESAPMADRKARAQTMWDNAKPGDVYYSPDVGDPDGSPFKVEIKANKDGTRYAEISSPQGKPVDTVPLDKEGGVKLSGNALIFGSEMTRQAPAPAAPIEPTRETVTKPGRHVRDKSGKRGEVTSEKEGTYEVEWDDGTKDTVKAEDVTRRKTTKVTIRNSIELAPHGEKVAVVKYDDKGNSTTYGTYDTVEEAEVKAKQVAEDSNYAGYKNENDEFVRIAGEPETEVTVEPQPGVIFPPGAEVEEQGLPLDMQQAFLAAQNTKRVTEEKALARIEKATGIKGLVNKVVSKVTGKPTKSTTQIYSALRSIFHGISDRDAEVQFRNMGLHTKMEDALRTMGIPINYLSSSKNGGAAAAINPNLDKEDATISLDISAADLLPMIETARRVGGDKAAAKLFDAILREEVIHAADFKAAHEEYNALSSTEKKKVAFRGMLNDNTPGRTQFIVERYTAIVKEAKRIADAAPEKDAKAIAQLLKNAFNVYNIPYNQETAGQYGYNGKPEGIFNYLLNQKDGLINDYGLQLIPEFLRQAKQFQLNGDITEATHAYLYDKIGKLFKAILNGVKRGLKDIIGTGKLPLVEQALADMDRVLAGDPSVNKQSSVQSIEYGTKEFTDFIGNTTITIGPDGKHQALYAIGSPAFGDGLGFRFEPETRARRMADNATAAGQHIGYAPMPVWVRAEQPAEVNMLAIRQQQGSQVQGWHPDALAQELLRNAYISQESLDKIIARDGKITNAALKERLQFIGYDSISFKHADGTPTVIVFEREQVASATGNDGVYSIDNLVHTKDPNADAFETEIVRLHNKNGGSSYNAIFGDMGGTDFYSVSSYPELSVSVKGSEILRQDIIDIRDRAMAEGIDLNAKHIVIGTWYNKQTGWTDIDISAMVPDLRAALEISNQHDQAAIFDLATFEAIFTNGAFPILGGLPSISERNGFIAAKAANPVEFLHDEDAFTVIAKENEQYKDWYARFAKYMRDNFLKDYPEYIPLINYLLASTSPSALVAANFTRMVHALRNFVETGDPGVGLDEFESHQHNLRRTVKLDPRTGKPVEEFENLSGLKITEYTPALFGDPTAMAIDRHVAMILFGVKNPTDTQREEAMRMIMRIAKRLKWTYAEVQTAFFAADLVKIDPKTGKPGKVDHYERTAELRRAEVYKLLDADRKAGGLGAKISASLLERTRKRIGVERLLGDDTRAKQQILRAREVAINEHVANAISLRGPPQKAAAKGGPSPGAAPAPTAGQDMRIPGGGNLQWFYQGVKHILWNSPGLAGLGNMVHKHINLRAKLAADYLYPIAKWMGDIKVAGVDIARPAIKQALNEHQEWRQNKGAGLPTKSLSPKAKELKNLIDGLIFNINNRNTAAGIKIKNPAGNSVPIPNIEYPAILQQKYLDAMREPHNHQTEWNELVDALKAEHIIPVTADDAMARNHIEKFLNAYDSNGAFGSFFFFNKMLPSMVHDYSLGGMQEFIQAWVDKVSLAESFGPNPNNDLFEFAIKKATSKDVKDFLRRVKNLAYGDTVNSPLGRLSSAVGGWASIQHLANWATATKDLVSGQIFNVNALGLRNYINGFWNSVARPFQSINDAREQGILLSDLMNIMTDGERIGGVREQVGKTAMSLAARNLVETWNRGIAFQGGKSLLRHAIYAYNKNPRSAKTLQYMAALRKLGFRDGREELILQEGGKGDLAGEYLRAQVNAIQAGYTYADVPAFVSEPAGKWFLKYSPWSIEHMRYFISNVLVQSGRGAGLAPKDKVTVIDPATGNKETRMVPRRPLDAGKLAWYLFLTSAGGAGEEWLLEQFFRMRAKTARWSEIFDRFKREDPRAWNELGTKLWQTNMLTGTFGYLGNLIQHGLVFAGLQEGKGGDKGILGVVQNMPSLDPIRKLYDSISMMWEQKAVTGKSLMDLSNAVSGIRVASQAASNVANDVFGADYWLSKMISNKQDIARIRNMQDRWTEDIGKDKAAKMIGFERMEKTEEAAWREPLHEALSVGDLAWAKEIVADVKRGMTPQRWMVESDELKKSIKAKQPIKGSEVARNQFMKWVKQTQTPYDVELVRRVDDTYRRTATQLGMGIEFKPPALKDVMEFNQKIKTKQQPTSYSWSPFKF